MKWYLLQCTKLFTTIKSHWFYILMSLLLPIGVYQIGQGVELIKTLFEIQQQWNIFFILISFYLMFYSLWVVNPFSLRIIRLIDKLYGDAAMTHDEEVSLYKKSVEELNNSEKVIPIRHFANLPFVIFHFLITSWFFFNKIYSFWIFIAWILMYLVVFHLTRNIYKKIHSVLPLQGFFKESPVWTGYILMVAMLFFISALWATGRAGQLADIFLIGILLVINNSLHHHIEHRVTPNFVNVYNGNKLRFKIAIISVALLIFIFYLASRFYFINQISPIAIGTVLITFYIIIFDGCLTTPSFMAELAYKNPYKKSMLQLGSLVCTIFFIYSYFSSPFSNLDIRVGNKVENLNKRDSLYSYYINWKAKQKMSPSDTVFLVSGQGGGSRAAAWTLINLQKLKTKKIFAISTVSGSSSGANSYVHIKYADLVHDVKTTDRNFCKSLYEYNYFSQSMWGLIIKDGIMNWIFRQQNRNFYHQEEEMREFRKNYTKLHKSKIKIEDIHSLQDEDYITKWYGNYKYQLPLLFTNATIAQTGKRAICSPIILEDKIFTTAVDLYASFHKDYPQNAMLSSTCVNVSQSFPFTSAASYLNSVANIIDGGLYENSGSNTLHEIYTYLKQKDPSQVFCILSINSSSEDSDNREKSKSEFANTISSATTTPFSGHSFYWLKKIEQDCKSNGDAYREVGLHKILAKDKEVALAIYLSKSTMDMLYDVAGWK